MSVVLRVFGEVVFFLLEVKGFYLGGDRSRVAAGFVRIIERLVVFCRVSY